MHDAHDNDTLLHNIHTYKYTRGFSTTTQPTPPLQPLPSAQHTQSTGPHCLFVLVSLSLSLCLSSALTLSLSMPVCRICVCVCVCVAFCRASARQRPLHIRTPKTHTQNRHAHSIASARCSLANRMDPCCEYFREQAGEAGPRASVPHYIKFKL